MEWGNKMPWHHIFCAHCVNWICVCASSLARIFCLSRFVLGIFLGVSSNFPEFSQIFTVSQMCHRFAHFSYAFSHFTIFSNISVNFLTFLSIFSFFFPLCFTICSNFSATSFFLFSFFRFNRFHDFRQFSRCFTNNVFFFTSDSFSQMLRKKLIQS